MTIDQKSLAEDAVDAEKAQEMSPETSQFIQTWLPSEEELDQLESDLKVGKHVAPIGHTSSHVEEWPDWLQKQWIASQRRRAWQIEHPSTARSRLFSPSGVLMIAVVAVMILVTIGVGTALNNRGASANSSPGASSSATGDTNDGMSGMGSQQTTTAANVPDATQQYGNQPAKYVMDKDGAKHFTLTAQQVMWQPVKGHKVLAWTLDGTVPGPMLRATAGDHIRVTIVNHLPEATTIHWHGLEVPTDNDGVPPVGMKPIQPGQSYTYDFTLQDQDAGTHWYHSHYDDLKQVGGGMYGAFIIAPRPGSPQYQPMMQAERADVDQTMFIGMLGGYYVINGKSFPDTPPLVVKHGQTAHLRMIGADTSMIHPMHLHGHSFQVVASDGHLLPAPYTKDTLSVAPGETYDVTFYAWAAPGSIYPLHCHILSHLMNPGQSGSEMGGLVELLEYQK
ncbi:MAG TPA: multicopper oxidase domain-containing protein [Ktedonobacterales bacterium]|nr:multicopper oxidase domain-containing protein [Ktedonobacterales bacterium]